MLISKLNSKWVAVGAISKIWQQQWRDIVLLNFSERCFVFRNYRLACFGIFTVYW